MEDQATSSVSVPQTEETQPREALIATAVTFLANKDVMRHPVGQKQQFLRSKGLSEAEIQIACDRAGVFTVDPAQKSHTVVNLSSFPSNSHSQGMLVLPKPSLFSQIRDVVNSIAVVSGLTYCIYLFYKRFIEPFLFGNKDKKKSVDESIRELEVKVERKMDELNVELIKVREEIHKTSFQNIKSDLDAIKGLLLNKKQFATPAVPPSIPAWQLATQNQEMEDHHDKIEDNDTGSGSSETEVVTKNSDSSLEIM